MLNEKCKYFSYKDCSVGNDAFDHPNYQYFCSKTGEKKEIYGIHCARCRAKSTLDRVNEHYREALNYFPEEQIVGIFLQGSQNYGLDYEGSDVDTKLILVPSFKDICLNKKPVSTTHVRANDEHTDWKDIRLYMETFRKQNLNFLEILFTDYYILNPMYEEQWMRLVEHREEIARMNPYRAVKSMKGIALEKFHAMEHPYPTKLDLIEKYGYDPKQVSHLVRIRDYLERYITGESYKDCLRPSDKFFDLIFRLKKKEYGLEEARIIAKENIDYVIDTSDSFIKVKVDKEDVQMRALLEDVSYNIMLTSVKKEIG